MTALKIFLWAWVAKEALSILTYLAFTIVFSLELGFDQADGSWSAMEWLQLFSYVDMAGGLVGLGVCAYGLLAYSSTARRQGAGPMVRGALAGCLVALAWALFSLVLHLVHSEGSPVGSVWSTVQHYGWMLGWAGELACIVLVLTAAARVSRALGEQPASGLHTAAFAVIGLAYLLPLLLSLLREELAPLGGTPWIRFGVTAGLNGAAVVMVFLVLLDHLRHLARAPDAEPAPGEAGDPDRFLDPPWPAVRKGLDVYRSGLIAKLLVVVTGYVLLVLAGLARSQGGVKVLMVMASFGGMITTVWMVAGLFGYARVPLETGGRGGVIATLVLIALGMVLDLWALVLIFRVFSGRLSAVYDAMDQMPYVEGIALVLGILGVMALLHSFKRVGEHAGSTTIGPRVALAAGLLLSVAVAAFSIKLLVAERVIRGMVVLPLAVMVLGVAIGGLVVYLRILRDLRLSISPGK